MIVCSCNVISDNDVRGAMGARKDKPSVGAVFRHIGCEAKCGRCVRSILTIVEQHAGGGLDEMNGNGEFGACRGEERAA